VKVRVLAIALLTDQQRFTVSKVAADWHELMVMILLCIMRPSIACASEQLDPRDNTTDIPLPQSATLGLHPIVHKLLLISHPTESKRRVGLSTQ